MTSVPDDVALELTRLRDAEKKLATGLTKLERLAKRAGGEHRMSAFDQKMFAQVRSKLVDIREHVKAFDAIVPEEGSGAP